MMKKFFGAVLLGMALTGCFLPPGEPPKGDLVCNRTKVTTRAQIAEHLATKLSLYLLEKHPRAAWMLIADASSLPLTENAVRECALLGSVCAANAPLQLRGAAQGDRIWCFTFFEDGKAVWSETYCEDGK